MSVSSVVDCRRTNNLSGSQSGDFREVDDVLQWLTIEFLCSEGDGISDGKISTLQKANSERVNNLLKHIFDAPPPPPALAPNARRERPATSFSSSDNPTYFLKGEPHMHVEAPLLESSDGDAVYQQANLEGDYDDVQTPSNSSYNDFHSQSEEHDDNDSLADVPATEICFNMSPQALLQPLKPANILFSLKCCGYLLKKGGGTRTFSRKSWKKRWFVFEKEVLSYYEHPGHTPLGTILADDIMDVVVPKPTKYQNEFQVVTLHRIFHFRAATPSDMKKWLHVLSAVVKHCTKQRETNLLY